KMQNCPAEALPALLRFAYRPICGNGEPFCRLEINPRAVASLGELEKAISVTSLEPGCQDTLSPKSAQPAVVDILRPMPFLAGCQFGGAPAVFEETVPVTKSAVPPPPSTIKAAKTTP